MAINAAFAEKVTPGDVTKSIMDHCFGMHCRPVVISKTAEADKLETDRKTLTRRTVDMAACVYFAVRNWTSSFQGFLAEQFRSGAMVPMSEVVGFGQDETTMFIRRYSCVAEGDP